jgi:hypothetical protein
MGTEVVADGQALRVGRRQRALAQMEKPSGWPSSDWPRR